MLTYIFHVKMKLSGLPREIEIIIINYYYVFSYI
jgi:hypothetical protein